MSSETIDVKFEHIKTFSFLHGELPIHLVDEVNNYIDEKGEINLNDEQRGKKKISIISKRKTNKSLKTLSYKEIAKIKKKVKTLNLLISD